MRIRYLIIPLAIFFIAVVGSFVTTAGFPWYRTIELPGWTPIGSFIGIMWTIIYILTGISALIFYEIQTDQKRKTAVTIVFITNAFLNLLWSYLFFNLHVMGFAAIDAGLLTISVILLMRLLWPVSRLSSLLLSLYAGWGMFATYLTYAVWQLNK